MEDSEHEEVPEDVVPQPRSIPSISEREAKRIVEAAKVPRAALRSRATRPSNRNDIDVQANQAADLATREIQGLSALISTQLYGALFRQVEKRDPALAEAWQRESTRILRTIRQLWNEGKKDQAKQQFMDSLRDLNLEHLQAGRRASGRPADEALLTGYEAILWTIRIAQRWKNPATRGREILEHLTKVLPSLEQAKVILRVPSDAKLKEWSKPSYKQIALHILQEPYCSSLSLGFLQKILSRQRKARCVSGQPLPRTHTKRNKSIYR